MLPEYRFDYTKACPNRFAVRARSGNREVLLDPDVAEVFTTPKAVNEVLRALILRRQGSSAEPRPTGSGRGRSLSVAARTFFAAVVIHQAVAEACDTGMDTGVLVCTFLLFSALTVVLFGLCAWGLLEERRTHQRGDQLRPGLRCGTDWSGSLGSFCGITTLVLLAYLAGQQEGQWKIVPLVFVNLVMQPLCLLFFVGSVYRVLHALRGRFTYGFQVFPRESIPSENYRSLLIERAVGGVVFAVFACGLSYVCVLPLL